MERTSNNQWLQASRTRANIVVKRRDTRSDSALCEDVCRRSCARSPWEVPCRSSCARSLRKAICTRCLLNSINRRAPQKIFVRDLKVRSLFKHVQTISKWSPSKTSALFTRSIRGLLARSLYKISIKDLSAQISWRGLLARPLAKIAIRDLSARSPYEISVQVVYKSPLGKMYVRDLLARSLQQISMQSMHCLCARSAEEVSWQDLCPRSV